MTLKFFLKQLTRCISKLWNFKMQIEMHYLVKERLIAYLVGRVVTHPNQLKDVMVSFIKENFKILRLILMT